MIKDFNEINAIKDYLKSVNTDGVDNFDVALLLKALGDANIYQKNGDFEAFVKKELDKVIKDENIQVKENCLCNMLYGNACYDLKENYGNVAINIAKQTKSQPRSDKGFFLTGSGKECLCIAYSALSFYMNYETQNGGKEQYNDIMAQYKSLHSELFKSTADRVASGDKDAYKEMVMYAAGLIDTMQVMSQELYEIFGALRSFYKDAVKVIIANQDKFLDMRDYNLLAVYAILKGCRMKALHTEKYESAAVMIYEEEASKCKDLSSKDIFYVGTFVAAYGEYIRNREYQDYGRGKGGALWS